MFYLLMSYHILFLKKNVLLYKNHDLKKIYLIIIPGGRYQRKKAF